MIKKYVKNLSELLESKYGKDVELYFEQEFEDYYIHVKNMPIQLLFTDSYEDFEDEEEPYVGKYFDTDINEELHVWLQFSVIPKHFEL